MDDMEVDDNEENEDHDDDDDDDDNDGHNDDGTVSVTDSRGSLGINKGGKNAEAGIISQVYVENFMCHLKLQVELCRNVNFIHGQNGSGKSAILAAIQICLGANAKRTNRARNLKDLVRRDGEKTAKFAKIRVSLYNEGSDAYKPDVYGNRITVERTIILHGGGYNGYKLLDYNGTERSRSKKDLEDMLDRLNIQVDNPVAILDQEEAKKFLTGKPSDKYKFFMKATELERVDRTYSQSCSKVQELSDQLSKAQTLLQPSIDKSDKLRKKYEQHIQIQKLEDKIAELHVQYAWACYSSNKTHYDESIQNKKKFEEKAAKKQEKLSQAEEAVKSPEVEENAKRQRVEELVQEAQEQTNIKSNLEKELKELNLPQKNLERQQQQLQKELAKSERRREDAKKRLQEARDEIVAKAGSAESEAARRASEQKQAEEELAMARQKCDQLKQAVSDCLKQYETVEPHVQAAKDKVKNASRQLNEVERTLTSLRSSANNSVAIFGQRVKIVHDNVMRATQDRKFRGPVLGPIGAFIKMVPGKEDFSAIAEGTISSFLDNFVVTNDHDRQLLQKIRNQAGCSRDCGILQTHDAPARFEVPDPPVQGIDTVASVLVVDNDLVFNCLVDFAKIDNKALGRDKESSERALLVDNGGRKSIRGNISQVYTLPNGDYWTVKNGTLANFSNERKPRNIIGVDQSKAVELAEKEKMQVQNEIQQLRRDESRLEQEHTDLQRAWNRARKANQNNDTLIGDLTNRLDEIRIEMETSTSPAEIDTSEQEEDYRLAEEAVEALKEKKHTLKDELQQRIPQIDELRRRIEECSLRNDKVLAETKAAENDLTNFLQHHSQIIDQVEKRRRAVEQFRELISKHQEKVDQCREHMESALYNARKLAYRHKVNQAKSEENGSQEDEEQAYNDPTEEDLEAIEPIVTDKDEASIKARIDRTRNKISTAREKQKLCEEDQAEAYENYIAAQNEVAKKSRDIRKLDENIENLTFDLRKRRKRWKLFRKTLEHIIPLKFNEMLNLNRYSGKIEFDDQEGTLDLMVHKNMDKGGQQQAKDAKSLSGGERSYTTMCLLLALGEELETPFRILDEFDVFLDPQVRKLTIDCLIHVAKQMKHRQFIFITPQDVSGLTPDNELRIWKLSPPTRRENAGGLSQATLNMMTG